MKVFLSVLLAALLGVERARSLVCFSCKNKQLVLPEAHRLLRLRQLLRDRICIRWHREHGGLWLHPEQGLLPDLPRPERQSWSSVRGYPLLPELPVQGQCGRWRVAGQHPRAGPWAPAQPAVRPAAAWPLIVGTLCPAQTPEAQEGRKAQPLLDSRGSRSLLL
ncbi:hypothetical protein CB1_001302004 [Camelus ferus]|nr:hypothetical protein CB1_001302004 [Camelus ferus]